MNKLFFIISFLISWEVFCADEIVRAYILKYAEQKDIPILLQELKNGDNKANPEYWKMLLEHPRGKHHLALFRHAVDSDEFRNHNRLEIYKLILDLASEKDFEQFFNKVADFKGPKEANLNTIKKVLKMPPYNSDPEILAMAMRIAPHAQQDFIKDLPHIYAGESWRDRLYQKLVQAFGHDFVNKHNIIPDYIVALEQIKGVDALFANGLPNIHDIEAAIRLGKNPRAYQYFLEVLKKNIPQTQKNYYWSLYNPGIFDNGKTYIAEHVIKTDQLVFYRDLVYTILKHQSPEDMLQSLKKYEQFLMMLNKKNISKSDIELIIKQLLDAYKHEPHLLDYKINFALASMKAPQGQGSSLSNIKLAISIPDDRIKQKAFLIGQENLQSPALNELVKYLQSPFSNITEQGLQNFLDITKGKVILDLNFSDILSGRSIYRQKAQKIIQQFAHAEDITWALEFLEKKSQINSPQALEILQTILDTPAIQRERGLIEMVIGHSYNETPLPLFKMAIKKLSVEDLKMFISEIMGKMALTYHENQSLLELILSDPFTARWDPFLKGFLANKGHSGVIKKELEIIKLARQILPAGQLADLEEKLQRNFNNGHNHQMDRELNRLDSIKSTLESKRFQNSKELLHHLLEGEYLNDLKLKSFKAVLQFGHPNDIVKLLEIIRKNEFTDIKNQIFLMLLKNKKSQRNLELLNAAMAINILDDKRNLQAISLIGQIVPNELAADLISHMNGVVLNDQQLHALTVGLKSWNGEEILPSFLNVLNKQQILPASVATKSLALKTSQIITEQKEMMKAIKSWYLNEEQLATVIEQAVAMARQDVTFRRLLLEQILNRDPAQRWRFTKTNYLLQKRSALILLKTYEGTTEVAPLQGQVDSHQLDRVVESVYGQTYRNKPHFRYEENNPLMRKALRHFAGGDLAPHSSCDQLRRILLDGHIHLEGLRSP